MLVEHSGQLVTRDELHRALWSADTFVDFNQGLNNAVSKIRDALRDSVEDPRYIDTLPKLGYRFIGKIDPSIEGHDVGIPGMNPVTTVNGPGILSTPANGRGHAPVTLPVSGPPVPANLDTPSALASGATSPRHTAVGLGGISTAASAASTRRNRIRTVLVAAFVVVLFSGVAVRYVPVWFRPSKLGLEWVPFTTLSGIENSPSFSPDGEQVAFDYLNGNEWNIYIKRLDDDIMVRLTESPDQSSCPSWSPDGRLIAYLKGDTYGSHRLRSGIFLMSPSGGEKRRLVDVPNVSCHVSWSPDSQTLVYGPVLSASEPAGLFLVDVHNPVPRRLLASPAGAVDDAPAFSHDGSRIVFARSTSLAVKDLYVIPSSGGEPKRITQMDANLGGPAWTSDDRRIIFWAGSGGPLTCIRFRLRGERRNGYLWTHTTTGARRFPVMAVG